MFGIRTGGAEPDNHIAIGGDGIQLLDQAGLIQVAGQYLAGSHIMVGTYRGRAGKHLGRPRDITGGKIQGAQILLEQAAGQRQGNLPAAGLSSG